jgi:hypothetical protein
MSAHDRTQGRDGPRLERALQRQFAEAGGTRQGQPSAGSATDGRGQMHSRGRGTLRRNGRAAGGGQAANYQ